jgi:hypothetical protein
LARKISKPHHLEAQNFLGTSAGRKAAQVRVWPDVWAEELKLKVDGHPFSVKGREFQIQIIRDESEWIIMPKGAQMGLTIFLVRTFHWIVNRGWHHLYLMPLKTGAIPFVQGRIDPIISSNDELAKRFKSVDNRLHKQTVENIALRIRGTNIWTELREIPSDVLVMDERDKMVEDNIPEAMARLDGSDDQAEGGIVNAYRAGAWCRRRGWLAQLRSAPLVCPMSSLLAQADVHSG